MSHCAAQLCLLPVAAGIDLTRPKGITLVKKNGKTPSDQSMAESTKRGLASFYEPYNADLLGLVRRFPSLSVLPSAAVLERELLGQTTETRDSGS